MAYKRELQPQSFLTGDAPDQVPWSASACYSPALLHQTPTSRTTLLAASVEGLEREDLRVLAVLATWLEIHHPWLNADRLTRLVGAYPGDRVRAFWCAMARFLDKDRRLAKLAKVYQGPRAGPPGQRHGIPPRPLRRGSPVHGWPPARTGRHPPGPEGRCAQPVGTG